MRFHEARTLILVNTSQVLRGLFRVVPQDPSTYAVARISPEPEGGQVTNVITHETRRPNAFVLPLEHFSVCNFACVQNEILWLKGTQKLTLNPEDY